jgi:hypothetical protein
MFDNRPEPPYTGTEAETLLGFLDFHRATLLWKLDDLDDEPLRRPMSGERGSVAVVVAAA